MRLIRATFALRTSYFALHSALVSQSQKPVSQKFSRNKKLKDQFMLKKILFALALPGSVLLFNSANAATFAENFSTNPAANDWTIFGDASLFQWNSTNQNLRVTWDSSKPNSYFHRALGTILAKDDDFSVAFDLRLSDIAIGVDPTKPFAMQLAVGFLNFGQATNVDFIRGSGFQSPNLVEFDYFADSGFGNSISTPMISSNNLYAGGGFTVGLELTPDDLFHIEMNYSASNQTLKTTMTKNGAAFGPIEDSIAGESFSDFRVDTIAVESYSDAGQDPNFGGSILAHGVLDNFVVNVPNPPVQSLTGNIMGDSWQAQFVSRTNWAYVLERTIDFQTWSNVSETLGGTGTNLVLQDTNALGEKAFYRVRAERP